MAPRLFEGSQAPTDGRQLMHDALLEAILEVSDESLYAMLADGRWLSRLPGSTTMPDVSVRLLQLLQHRILHKEYARADSYTHNLQTGEKEKISAFLAGSKRDEDGAVSKFEAAENRLASLHSLEEDFQLPTGSLAMYCVAFGLGQKLADAKILIKDKIWKLRDTGPLKSIDGGHLAAQLERFHGLWRASLFIREDAARMMDADDLRAELRDAFTIGVLGLRSGENSMENIAERIADRRENGRVGPRRKLLEDSTYLQLALDEAAQGSPGVAVYPSGAPRAIAFFEPIDL